MLAFELRGPLIWKREYVSHDAAMYINGSITGNVSRQMVQC